MNENIIKILFQIIIVSDIIFKLFIIFIGIKRLLKIKKNMKIDNKYIYYSSLNNSNVHKIIKNKWTFFSMVKFIINNLIVLIYLFLIIINIFNNKLWNYDTIIDKIFVLNFIFYIYCIISVITWLISSRLFYKEFRIYKDQTWYGIRTFWIINSIIIISEIIFIFFIINIQLLFDFPNYIFFILLLSITLFSIILFFLSIFHPYDIIIKKSKIISKNENILNETQISTNFQEDLNSNSNSELDNESEIYSQNMNNIIIELQNNEINNNKQYNIELKIKTKDFIQLIFKIKIQKNKYKKSKKSLYVCNFNEIILKHYTNKSSSKEVLNLLKQAYNISLTLNPKRNSFIGDKKETNLLAHIYIELIKQDNRFLLDLLTFLEIKDNEIINALSQKYTSIYEENPLIKKEIERMDSFRSIFNYSNESGYVDTSLTSNEKKSIDWKATL